MKKQENKKNKWLLPTLAALVLVAIVTVVLVLVLPGGGQTAQPAQTTAPNTPADTGVKLYWNIDREDYKSAEIPRSANSEGQYRVNFAVDGEQVTLFVADYYLMCKIDTMEVMTLTLDQDGVVVDAQHVEESYGSFVANHYYVEAIDGNTVTANANSQFTAYTKTLEISENTAVYQVGGDDALAGLASTLQPDDEIIAIADDQGNITHVYTEHVKPVGTIYWNVTKKYDSATKMTTREQDALGAYVYQIVVNGELIELKTYDITVANKVDGVAAKCMGLEYDENGIITNVISPQNVTGGGSTASWYHVSAINENGKVSFERRISGTNQGKTTSAFLASDCKIYDVTGYGPSMGAPTDLRVDDQVHCLLNSRGKICYIFVVGGRTADSEMYWNVDRQWNKETLSTDRVPDAEGWYYFLMAVNGKHVTVKTKDVELANKMEKAVNMGLKLNGDIVEGYYAPSAVTGGSAFASWYQVTELTEDGQITAYKKDGDKTDTAVMASDCKIFNVSTSATLEGEQIDSIQVGDYIHCYKNARGEVAIIYVVTRYPDTPIYWNYDRQYDSKNKVSTRTRAADGYFYVDLTVQGKQVTLKTADQEIINFVDSKSWQSLYVDSNGVITKTFTATQTQNTRGGLFVYDYNITKLSGRTVTVEMLSGKDKGTVKTGTLASNCQIYDVSKTAGVVGEKTTLSVGDKIYALLNGDKEISVIYVTSATNHAGHSCEACDGDVVWTAYKAGMTLTDGGHYCMGGDMNVYMVYEENATVTICLNGMNIAGNARVFNEVPAGVTLNIVDCQGTATVHGRTNTNGSIMTVNGGTVNIYGGTYTSEAVTAQKKNGGMITIVGGGTVNIYDGTFQGGKTTGYGGIANVSDGTLNLYGGTITGGTSDTFGGNIVVSSEKGTLNVYGGTVSGGTATTFGGNIAVFKGTVNISGGQVTGGTASTHGGNIAVALGELTVTGGAVTGGTATTNGGNISIVNDANVSLLGGSITGGKAASGSGVYHASTGTVALGGNVNITGNQGSNLMLPGTRTVAVSKLTGKVGLSVARTGVIISGLTQAEAKCFTNDGEGELRYVEGDLILHIPHIHCACVNAEVIPAGHTCDESTEWQGITESTTITENGYYYLNWKANKAAAITVAEGVDAYLCLNGATVYAQKTITIGQGASLTVCDCSEEQTGTVTVSKSASRGPVQLSGDQTLTLISGTISGTGNSAQYQSVVMNKDGAKFNMYGGKLVNGVSGQNQDGTAKNGGNLQLSMGSATILGGSITGGATEGKGENIYVGGTATLTLGGSVKLDGIYLNGSAISVDPSLSGASVKVTPKGNGTVATGLSAQQAQLFTVNTTGTVRYNEAAQTLEVYTPHAHCSCVNAGTLPQDHTCDESIEWQGITASTTLSHNGHYYLDFEKAYGAAAITVPDGVTAFLCLNGKTVYATKTITIGEDASLTVCDCSEEQTGKITVSGAATRSPVALDGSKTLDLISGTICGTGNGAQYQSVVMTDENALFNMYGGKLEDGVASNKNGGNLQLSMGTANILAGSITGGTATGSGQDIYVGSVANLTLGGKVTIGDIYLNKASITVLPTLAETRIDLTVAETGVAVTGLTEAQAAYFQVTDGVVQYLADTQELTVTLGHVHCYCAGGEVKPENHACTETQLWTALTADTTLEDGGHYYLQTGYSSTITLPQGEVFLCLNGQTLTGTGRIFTVGTGVTLHICDCSAEYDEQTQTWTYGGTAHSTYNNNGAVALVNGGTLNIYGGSFTANEVTATNKNGALMTLIGNGSIHIYGGNVTGGKCTGYGGNINVSSGTLTLHGGTVSNGTSGSGKAGGNVAVSSASGTFIMEGGLITGGHAGSYGGNISCAGGKVQIKGGIIENGTATTHGGNLGIGTGSVTVEGGTIRNGTATTNGGNISLYNTATLAITGGSVTGGTAGTKGYCVYIDNNNLTLSQNANVEDVTYKN